MRGIQASSHAPCPPPPLLSRRWMTDTLGDVYCSPESVEGRDDDEDEEFDPETTACSGGGVVTADDLTAAGQRSGAGE